MDFTRTTPDCTPIALWKLQTELLQLAEGFLGPRDLSQIICQPVFLQGGPYLWFEENRAAAVLSPDVEGAWQGVVYEMAHETIHLLNPTKGYTNWLEEGAAVAFSLYALEYYGMDRFNTTSKNYTDALELVMELPGSPFEVPRIVRTIVGALNAATVESLLLAAPNHEIEKLERLVSICVPR